MSRVITYLEAAVQGLCRYLEANKLIVLLIAVVLAWWLVDKKPKEANGRKMLLYTFVMSVLLFFPVTAVVVMIYQTAYYDYEWAWSMVPITAVIAYGATLLIEHVAKQGKLLLGILATAAVIGLCGNQGELLTVKGEAAEAQENTTEILQAIDDFSMGQQCTLWAPKSIMEQVRRKDGKILLIYGRDMWDIKAGSYDYEAYSEELTEAYRWLERMIEKAQVASIMADPAAALVPLCEEEKLDEARDKQLRTVLEEGVNVLVFPNLVAEYIEESIFRLAEEKELELKNTYTEEYTIYLLE